MPNKLLVTALAGAVPKIPLAEALAGAAANIVLPAELLAPEPKILAVEALAGAVPKILPPVVADFAPKMLPSGLEAPKRLEADDDWLGSG